MVDTWIFVALRLDAHLRRIPSQTLADLTPVMGHTSGRFSIFGYLHQYPHTSQLTRAKIISTCLFCFSKIQWYRIGYLETLPLYKTPTWSLHYHSSNQQKWLHNGPLTSCFKTQMLWQTNSPVFPSLGASCFVFGQGYSETAGRRI